MGRAGSGGHSSGHSSSGGHSSGRSSGGHSMGSSGSPRARGSAGNQFGRYSRNSNPGTYGRSGAGNRPPGQGAGRGNYGGGRNVPPPPRQAPPPPSPRHRYNRGMYSGGYYNRGISTVAIIMVLCLLILFGRACSSVRYSTNGITSSESVPASTTNRETLDLGIGFDNNCIVDELGWVENISSAESGLKYFYQETGVQPYFVFLAYDEELTTDDEKTAYAEDWYDANIDNEGTFLVMYFAEEDADNDVGYMAYVAGKQTTTVMDSEAVEIFWAYLDEYWYSDLDTDEMLIQAFSDTADRIMEHTTTKADVAKYVVVGIIIVAAGIIIIRIMVLRRKHRREENAEAQKILETPLSGSDPLADKYTNTNKED